MSASIPANNPPGDRALLPSKHTGLLMAACMGVTVCQFLDMTIANVAIPHMQTSLGAGMDSISLVLTSFIIAGVLVLPLTGWLSDRFGSRNLFILSTAAFVLASMLCGAATSLTQMVIFRAIQGASSAFIGPLSQTVMFDINPPSKQARTTSIWGAVVMIAPISGPFIGGFLTESLNWRWVFYVNLPVGIPALVILWWLLPSRPIIKRKLDIFGATMLGLALCAIQLMLDRGGHNDWFESREIVAELVFALCALWVFFVHTRTTAHPLFDGKLIRNPNFLMALVFMVILGVVNVALSAVLPTMYQNVYGYDVMDTGLLMAPRGCGVLVTMLVTQRLIGKVDSRLLLSLGYSIAALSLWTMMHWSINMGSDLILISGFIQGMGLGFVFVPANMIAFSTLSSRFRTDGMTLMTLFRNLGSSFGISVIITILGRNIQTSHADIAASVTSFNVPAIDPATSATMMGNAGAAALSILNGEVSKQAAMVGYLDNFYMMFWVMLCVVPLSWLLRKPNPMGMMDQIQSE